MMTTEHRHRWQRAALERAANRCYWERSYTKKHHIAGFWIHPQTFPLFVTFRVVGSHSHRRNSGQATAVNASRYESNVEDSQDFVIRLTNVATMHAVILSGLELALSLINALDENAFVFDSWTNFVFGASATIEAIGFFFAISMVLFGGDDIGGSPLLATWAFWEAKLKSLNTPSSDEVASARAKKEDDAWKKIVNGGLLPQTMACAVCAIYTIFNMREEESGNLVAISSWGFTVLISIVILVAVLSLLYCGFRRIAAALVGLTATPFLVEACESVLILRGDSNSSSASSYILAVLDLFVIIPVLVFPAIFSWRANDSYVRFKN